MVYILSLKSSFTNICIELLQYFLNFNIFCAINIFMQKIHCLPNTFKCNGYKLNFHLNKINWSFMYLMFTSNQINVVVNDNKLVKCSR